RNDAPFIVRFQVVHIRDSAVHIGSDAVTCAVKKEWSKAALIDVAAGNIVDFVAGERLPSSSFPDDEVRGLLSRIPNNLEHILQFVRDGIAAKSGPGYVVIDGVWFCELSPKIDQN